jgi:hypothetical protein
MKMTMPSSAPADALVKYFARWGVSTLKGALSTLTRLRTYAEAKGEYEAADNDVYSAQLVNSFLDEINVRAIEAAAAYHRRTTPRPRPRGRCSPSSKKGATAALPPGPPSAPFATSSTTP